MTKMPPDYRATDQRTSIVWRPNSSKFRYTLINTSKLILPIVFTYLLLIRDDLYIWNIDRYSAAVIGQLKRVPISEHQSATSFMSAWVLVYVRLVKDGG